MGKYAFDHLVDINKLQELMDKFYNATGIPVGIIDVEGNIKVAAGWQDICARFHGVHPKSLARCQQSDSYIQNHLHVNGGVDYTCRNGLQELAVPLVIAGDHVATFFLGQFFYSDVPLDKEFFRRQAVAFGFDEKEYMAALSRVPVYTREKAKEVMEYSTSFVHFIVETCLSNLKRIEMEKALQHSKAEAGTGSEALMIARDNKLRCHCYGSGL